MSDPDDFDIFTHTAEEYKAHLATRIKKMCEEAAEQIQQERLLDREQKKVKMGLSRIQ